MLLNADTLTLHAHHPQLSTKCSTGTLCALAWHLCTYCCLHPLLLAIHVPQYIQQLLPDEKNVPSSFSFFFFFFLLAVCSVSFHSPLLSQQFFRKELFQGEKVNLLSCHCVPLTQLLIVLLIPHTGVVFHRLVDLQTAKQQDTASSTSQIWTLQNAPRPSKVKNSSAQLCFSFAFSYFRQQLPLSSDHQVISLPQPRWETFSALIHRRPPCPHRVSPLPDDYSYTPTAWV